MDAEVQRAAEARRQAARKELSERERKHAQNLAIAAIGGLVALVFVCLLVIATWG